MARSTASLASTSSTVQLLPTAPGVNPQETIMALSNVLSRRIVERHPSG
jgi:choline dehydrogenase-like flavoprotein